MQSQFRELILRILVPWNHSWNQNLYYLLLSDILSQNLVAENKQMLVKLGAKNNKHLLIRNFCGSRILELLGLEIQAQNLSQVCHQTLAGTAVI